MGEAVELLVLLGGVITPVPTSATLRASNPPKMPMITRITIPAIFSLLLLFRARLLLVPLPAVGGAAKEAGFPQWEQNFEFGSIFVPQWLQ